MSDLVLYVEKENVAAENRTACCPETHINNTTGVGAGGQERITHKDRMVFKPSLQSFATQFSHPSASCRGSSWDSTQAPPIVPKFGEKSNAR